MVAESNLHAVGDGLDLHADRSALCRRDSRQAHQQDLRAELQGVSHRERFAEHLRRRGLEMRADYRRELPTREGLPGQFEAGADGDRSERVQEPLYHYQLN